MQVCFVSVSQSSPNKSIDALLAACIHHTLAVLYIINLQQACGQASVMNSTCIHYEGSRPEYIHVQVLGTMHKTPYTTGKLQKIHIHLTTSIIDRYIRLDSILVTRHPCRR